LKENRHKEAQKAQKSAESLVLFVPLCGGSLLLSKAEREEREDE
jgi:hypothetical protein